MSKFNNPRVVGTYRGATSVIKASATPNTTTYEGGPGHTRDVKSELFQLAVVNMVSEKTFYEDAVARDGRYAQLVRQATLDDPDWTARLLAWLRTTANMRSAPLVGAAEYTRARLEAGLAGTSRQVVSSVLQRADEPGELLAYWTSRYGRAIPKPLKRGVADAATRLYTERSMLRYDTSSHAFRFADVIDLTHPTPKDATQADLFRHALDRRHGRSDNIPETLPAIRARRYLNGLSIDDRYEFAIAARDGGLTVGTMTVERVRSLLKLAQAGQWEWFVSWLGGTNTE